MIIEVWSGAGLQLVLLVPRVGELIELIQNDHEIPNFLSFSYHDIRSGCMSHLIPCPFAFSSRHFKFQAFDTT